MRRAVVLLVAVAIAAAIAAAWLAPATLLDARLVRATGGVIRLADADGTLRKGHGSAVAGTMRVPIAWQVELWPLLRGLLRLRLVSGIGAPAPRATIAIGRDTIALHDVDIVVPAEVVAAVLDRTSAALVSGEVSLKAEGIEWGPGLRRGEARVVWHAARIVVAGAVPVDLGVVRTLATADSTVFAGPVGNEGGEVAVRGEWTLRANDDVELALHVTPRRPGLSDLERVLSAVGRADGDGWRIDWRAAPP